jgi:hypothetical protein
MDQSKLHFYSVGRVAENKLLSEHVIWVTPVEHLPMLDGELKKEPQPLDIKGLDKDDNEYQMELTFDNVVPAHWLPMGSNRQTSPDVRRGERVLIWRYADADRFYWTDMGLDQPLRKLETVRHVYSATQEEDTEVSADNHYYAEVSTHNKTLTLHTSQANDEPFSYDIQIDTEKGQLTVTDNDGNYLHLDSKAMLWHIHNKEGTEVKLDKQEIWGYGKGLIKFRSDTKVHVTAPLIDLGETSALEPSVLGDKFAKYWKDHTDWINNHIHLGNMGIPTSVPIVPCDPTPALKSGYVYSTINRNQ